MVRIYFCAGESSGDIHGANVIRALRDLEPHAECAGLGGQQMARAGMRLDFDLAGIAIMGFIEVIKRFSLLRNLFKQTAKRLREERPDCLVLIDYPGFNLQLAKRAWKDHIPVVYYISPQIWAWKRGRIDILARVVRKMLVILPFEEALYRAKGVDCAYVGHPLIDHIAGADIQGKYREDMVIGLMPGSREQEIERIFPVMVATARGIQEQYPEARFVVPCVDAARQAQVQRIAADFPVDAVIDATYELLDGARFCLVASGTATVETALFGVPMIIAYRVNPLTYWMARWLVRIDHIGMVNILAGKRIVPEFVQHEARVEAILPVALELIAESPARAQLIEDLAAVHTQLGGGGASKRAAQAILDVARETQHG